MKNSNISWTDHTANFWWGCQIWGVDCARCYAKTYSERWGKNVWGSPENSNREVKKAIWKDIKKWDTEAMLEGKRKRVFVMSMGDFLEDHPQIHDTREKAKDILTDLKWLDVLLLTKRPENAPAFLSDWFYGNWPEHIWFGMSAGNQETMNERARYFVDVPAKIKFLSLEPLLGGIDLTWVKGEYITPNQNKALNLLDGHVQWVIIGGESGDNFREMNIYSMINMVDQCISSNVPVFVKQDSGKFPGKQGRIPNKYFIQQFPKGE